MDIEYKTVTEDGRIVTTGLMQSLSTSCCCGSEDCIIVEDQHGERVFCAECGNELYLLESEEARA